VQGNNAQAVVSADQIVIAAEIRTVAAGFGHLELRVAAARTHLQAAGATEQPGVVLADAGYSHQPQMERLVTDGIQVLIRPDGDQPTASAQARSEPERRGAFARITESRDWCLPCPWGLEGGSGFPLGGPDRFVWC